MSDKFLVYQNGGTTLTTSDIATPGIGMWWIDLFFNFNLNVLNSIPFVNETYNNLQSYLTKINDFEWRCDVPAWFMVEANFNVTSTPSIVLIDICKNNSSTVICRGILGNGETSMAVKSIVQLQIGDTIRCYSLRQGPDNNPKTVSFSLTCWFGISLIGKF